MSTANAQLIQNFAKGVSNKSLPKKINVLIKAAGFKEHFDKKSCLFFHYKNLFSQYSLRMSMI